MMPRRRMTAVVVLAFMAAGPLCPAVDSPATPDPSDWSAPGLNDAETRDSPLGRIAPANVAALKPAWFADLTDVSQRAFEATPLVVGGRLYVSTGWSVAVAFDAATGREDCATAGAASTLPSSTTIETWRACW